MKHLIRMAKLDILKSSTYEAICDMLDKQEEEVKSLTSKVLELEKEKTTLMEQALEYQDERNVMLLELLELKEVKI